MPSRLDTLRESQVAVRSVVDREKAPARRRQQLSDAAWCDHIVVRGRAAVPPGQRGSAYRMEDRQPPVSSCDAGELTQAGHRIGQVRDIAGSEDGVERS